MVEDQSICPQSNFMINQKNIFFSNQKWHTRDDLVNAMIKVGANDCNILYVHFGFSFGMPNPDLPRSVIINEFYEALLELGVQTICMPTFTFSFCNAQDYHVEKSKSSMGALNEYFRNRPESIRSCDPLMSSAVIGQDKDLVLNFGGESVGRGSTFDRIFHKNKVKFLFMGTYLPDCFTYMHYLEWRAKVPYRYNRNFEGNVTCEDKMQEKEATLFVRYNNVKPNALTTIEYGEKLKKMGFLKEFPLGQSSISCVEKDLATDVYLDILSKDVSYFVCDKFSELDADKRFFANNMVAL